MKTDEVQKSQLGIFARYGKNTNAYRVYIPELNTITTSVDVHFAKEESYTDLLVNSEEQKVLDPEGSTEGVEGRADADLERMADADPLPTAIKEKTETSCE